MNVLSNMELNAFIAEKVMGWKRVSAAYQMVDGTFLIRNSDKQVFSSLEKKDVFPYRFCATFFSPTTDEAQAMQVLKRCAKKVVITIQCEEDCTRLVSAFVNGTVIRTASPTLELAICLFAHQLFKEGK